MSRARGLSIACLLGLSAAALTSCATHSQPQAGAPQVFLPPRPSPATARLDPRRFLAAFLRYETSAPSAALRRQLLATATPDFAAQLLAAPPTPAAHRPPARIARLQVNQLSAHPPRALVSGTAMRAGHPEPFSFLFETRAGRWLAAGPAE